MLYMEGDGEAEDLDWMNEETYCAISSTPVTKLSSDGNYRLPISSYGINKTVPSVHNDIHLYNLSSQIMKQEKNLPQTILRATQAYTLMPVKDPSRGGEVTASYLNFNVNKYSTLTQRVVRTRCSGVTQIICVLLSRDFVKNQDAVVVCPQCDHLYANLQSLDDHMISLHDVDVDVNDTEGCTPNVIIIAPRVANSDQASQFSCSVCNQVLDSTTQEWQRHVYMHLRSRTKRVEDNEASEVPRAAEVIVIDEVKKAADDISLLHKCKRKSSAQVNETSYYEPLVSSKSQEKAPNKQQCSAEIRLIGSGNNDSFLVESCYKNDNDDSNGNAAGSNASKSSKNESSPASNGNDNDQQAVKNSKQGKYVGFQPTTCNHCGVLYEKRRELVAHINSEHAEKLLQCPSCPKQFALADSIKAHNKGCRAEEMYTCRWCDMKFLTPRGLQRHIGTEHLDKSVIGSKKKHYNCTLCGKTFHAKQTLDGHINQHHLNVRPYKCSTCGAEFCYVNSFKMHELVCTKSMICELCGENFTTKATLAEHHKTAHNTVRGTLVDAHKFRCYHCSRAYPDAFSLKCHLLCVNAVSSTPSLVCDICGKKCLKPNGLAMHKAYRHPHEVAEREVSVVAAESVSDDVAATSDASTYAQTRANSLANSFCVAATPVICSDCGQKFPTSTALRRHQMLKHPSNGLNKHTRFTQQNEFFLACPSCGRKCRGKVGLSVHLRMQHAETQLTDVKCDKCDRTFNNQLGLDVHKGRAHSDTRKYRQATSCSICSKKFLCRGSLKSHMKSMHGVPAATQRDNSYVNGVFNCHICGRQFKQKSYLHRHLRFHAGPKPYICTVCSKRFNTIWKLSRHMASLHKDVEYTYNPLVNMVCNVAPNSEQSSAASQNVPPQQKSISESSVVANQNVPPQQKSISESSAVANQSVPPQQKSISESSAVANQSVPPQQKNISESSAVANQNVPPQQKSISESLAVANQNVPPQQKSISESSGASGKSSNTQKLAPAVAVATMNNADPPSPLKSTEPQITREETAGYLQQDILNILRNNNQPGPRDVSANIELDMPTMQLNIPCMVMMEISEMTVREFPNMNTANIENIPREMSSLLLRESTTMPQDSSGSPQVFILPC